MQIITIFTPTYNRSDLLERAYGSLVRQTCKDFEWVVVDDGSTDDTAERMQRLIAEDKISIKYFRQQNRGKHIAINQGVRMAAGILFAILDNDDELTEDAVSSILREWKKIDEEGKKLGGVVFNKRYTDGKLIGADLANDTGYSDMSIIDFRFKKKVQGDRLEVFQTSLLRQFPFPDTDERFCPEALVWNRIGHKIPFRFVNQAIYIAEYLPGGLTDKIVTIRKASPHNTSVYYSELAGYDIPLPEKIKAAINFWRFAVYDKKATFGEKLRAAGFLRSLIGIPLGCLYAFMERNK